MTQLIETEANDNGKLSETKYGLPIDESYSKPATEERIRRTADALTENRFIVHVVDTAEDARKLVEGLLPIDKGIFTASSKTVNLSGLDEAINGPGTKFQSVRQEIAKLDRATQFREQVKLGATPDVVVGSVHAITESGRIFAASASGSQLASYAAGAAKVIWVVGSQKIVKNLEDAMRRLEFYSYPLEDVRMHEAAGMPSSLSKILIVNREPFPGRTTIVIVREAIGF